MGLIATFNPYDLVVTKHAKERFLSRVEEVDDPSETELEEVDAKIRDLLVGAVSQNPGPIGPKRRRNYMVGKFVFVLSENRQFLVTVIDPRETGPKSLVKKKRKNATAMQSKFSGATER